MAAGTVAAASFETPATRAPQDEAGRGSVTLLSACRDGGNSFAKKLIPARLGALMLRASRFDTEGCLISILRHETGSGGRGMTRNRRCDCVARRSKPQRSRRTCRAPPGPVMAEIGNRSQVRQLKPGPTAVDRRPANSQGEAGCLKWEVHRGRCGANLRNTARGTPWEWRTCGGLPKGGPLIRLGAARCRGLRVRVLLVCARCVNLSAPRTLGVPRALGAFRGNAARPRSAERAKADGNGNAAYPGPIKEYGR